MFVFYSVAEEIKLFGRAIIDITRLFEPSIKLEVIFANLQNNWSNAPSSILFR